MLEKIFKNMTVIMSLLLAVCIVITVCCIPSAKYVEDFIDIFGSKAIAENIKNMEMNMTSVVYAKNYDGEWEEYHRIHGEENRLWVSIDKMPKHLIDAFIAIEDETFYDHSGINWKRTFGAIGNMLFKFDDTEFGGSTITQQLIKNVTGDKGHNATRKIREIVRALIIDKRLTKKQVLEAYLNTIALGNGICGVQVAANYYFNKDVNELDVLESATIAAITKNPSKYNPVTGMKENKKRRNLVLEKMRENNLISVDGLLEVYDEDIELDVTQKENLDPEINDYFIDTLIQDLTEDLMEEYDYSEAMASTMIYNGGLKIYATVNVDVQEKMETVYENVDRYFYLKGKNLQGEKVHAQSGMTIMNYTGGIVGIVGGAGEKTVNRGLNRAHNIPQQPGSTMKPIGVYALAVENNLIHYSSKVIDEPIPHYTPDGKPGPKEWYGEYRGLMTVDYAVRKSANTIPVILLQKLGVKESYNFLTKKLGLKHLTKEDENLSSLALGGCVYGMTPTESAAAYAVFGNGGLYYEPTTYTKVKNVEGDTVLKYKAKGKQVISEETATIMNRLLQGVVYGSEGTGGSIAGYSGMKAYAKTGTSSESNDLWMVAGTPYYVGSVWYGFDLRQTIHSTSAAAVIWRDVMREVHRPLKYKNFTYSENVVMLGSGYYKRGLYPDNLTLYTGETSSGEGTESGTSSAVTPGSSSVTQNGAIVPPGQNVSGVASTITSSQSSQVQSNVASKNPSVTSPSSTTSVNSVASASSSSSVNSVASVSSSSSVNSVTSVDAVASTDSVASVDSVVSENLDEPSDESSELQEDFSEQQEQEESSVLSDDANIRTE